MPLAQGISSSLQSLAVWQLTPRKSAPQSHPHPTAMVPVTGRPLWQVKSFAVHCVSVWHRFPSYPAAQLHVQLPVCPFAVPPFSQAMISAVASSSEQSFGSWHVVPSHPAAQLHPQSPPATDPVWVPPFWHAPHVHVKPPGVLVQTALPQLCVPSAHSSTSVWHSLPVHPPTVISYIFQSALLVMPLSQFP